MIVILHSAVSSQDRLDDQETLTQVNSVSDALKQLGYTSVAVPFVLDFEQLKTTLNRHKPKLVFNLVESIHGRSDFCHLVPLWLEELKLPYTGGRASSLLLCSDKLFAKKIFKTANIPSPSYITAFDLTDNQFPENGPYIIKSAREDGSLGIDQSSVVNDHASFTSIINDRQQRFGGEWFAERYIAGRELNIGLLASPKGPEILPIAEIEFLQYSADQFTIVDYAAKWHVDSKEYKNTPSRFNHFKAELLKELNQVALNCWHTFSVTSCARVDVRVDEYGKPWVLELNINPSLAPDAGFAGAAARAGLEYPRLIERIVNDALTRGQS